MTEITTTIREATPADAEAFARCQVDCWREAYSDLWDPERFASVDDTALAAEYRQRISTAVERFWMAEVDGDVVGIAIAGPSGDDDAPTPLELHAIYVREAFYGTGIATKLLDAVTAGEPVSLWVYRDNPRASAFYVNRGFIVEGAERVDPSGILELRFIRH